MSVPRVLFAALLFLVPCGEALGDPGVTPAAALTALERAGAYFRDHLEATIRNADGDPLEGAMTSALPAGEGATRPLDTPAIGAAFLRIYEVTGDKQWLEAARAVAAALVDTQLQSGGWYYEVERDPGKAGNWCYRVREAGRAACQRIKGNPNRNETVLDANNTQNALNFLMWFDQASGSSDATVRNTIEVALNRLMKVQYPNGAFPVFFSDDAPAADIQAAARASLPANWSREWREPDNPPYFVLNRNVPRDVGRLFLNAYRVYDQPLFLRTATRIGDFLLSTQLPAPQQGWAKAYDRALRPVWGGKSEPPALAPRETAGSIDYLLELYGESGESRFLQAARSAAAWLSAARLPDGFWARFYELGTNRPLHLDADNRLVLDDPTLPSVKGGRIGAQIKPVLARFRRQEQGQPAAERGFWISAADDLSPAELGSRTRQLIESQEAEGRWTLANRSEGEAFAEGVFDLARFASERGFETAN